MAAAFFSLGKLTVPSPGTPVNVPAPILPGAGPTIPGLTTVHAAIVEALETNTGKVYVCLQGANKTSRAGVLLTLPIPTPNLIPAFSVSITAAANAVPLTDLYIDADVAGEGVTISGLIT